MSRRHHLSRSSAFSLVEIAVVIAILGLLVGGVLSGQSLIRGQQLRAVGTDAGNYMLVMQQFKKKYGYLAGDFPAATETWGRVGGGTAQCAAPDTNASVGATTCNGDGNGYLTAGGHEPHRAWQHLAAAGLIPGNFTGIAPYAIGVSAPKGSLNTTGFGWVGGLIVVDSINPSTTYFDGDYTNLLTFGALATIIDGPALTPAQAFELDSKIDDGKPASGRVRAYKSSTACASSATNYNVGASTNTCAILFLSAPQSAI